MPETTPPSPREETFASKGGTRIFFRSWRPQGEPRAVIVICHGVNSHGGQYLWAAERFAEAGYAVFALDLRGRGRSEGRRFFVANAADYVVDVAGVIALAKARMPGLPAFLLGHSAGGVVSCSYALDRQQELAGLVCESFAFKVSAPDLVLAVVKSISHLAPGLPVLRLKNEDFSRDPAVVKALNTDPLTAAEAQPALTVAALTRANERLDREFGRISLPLLILHGTADKVTLPAGSIRFHEKAGSTDKTLKLYEGHVHDLLSDIGKESVTADILHWIEARLPKGSAIDNGST